MKEGSQYYFYHNDHLGTPQKLTAVNGAVVWSAKYSSFGEATVEVEAVEDSLRFPGQYHDAETGLHYNYHRYYDPTLGRYLSEDPIGLDGGTNLYVYVSSNPINWVDPTGLVAGQLIKFYAKRAALCKALNKAYKAAEKQGKGCKGGLSCPKYKKLIPAIIAEVTGRAAYLKKSCDYFLPGSIKRGPRKAKRGHKIQLAEKMVYLGKCIGHAVRANCCKADTYKIP